MARMARKSSPSDAPLAAARRSSSATDLAIRELRELGLSYPGAHLKSPWPGHEDLAVKDRTFAYLPPEGEPFSISCKLPDSSHIALLLPYATPTGYGLGKSGWVSAKIPDGEPVPLDLFRAWIDESYRAQAPKKLIAELDGAAPKAAGTKRAAKKTAAKKTAAAKPTAGATKKRASTTKKAR